MEDQDIIQLLWDRAERAIEALARKFGSRLLTMANNILGSHEDAEECVSDTYLAVWNTVPELAAEMGMKENTVTARLSRIRTKLKAYLIQEGFLYE